MQKYNFSYDKEQDDLFVYSPRSKSKGSVELGNLVFDYNSKKEFVGLQIARASKMTPQLSDMGAADIKEILSSLTGCKVEAKVQNNLLSIKLLLIGKTKEVYSKITAPVIRESSPAVAYA